MTESNKQIQDLDFQSAQKMIKEGIGQANAALVAQTLAHPSLIIRRHAAEALARVGSKAEVPLLLDALKHNQGRYSGGSETDELQVDLNVALISALRKLTGADFGHPEHPSEHEVQKIMQDYQMWWTKNQK